MFKYPWKSCLLPLCVQDAMGYSAAQEGLSAHSQGHLCMILSLIQNNSGFAPCSVLRYSTIPPILSAPPTLLLCKKAFLVVIFHIRVEVIAQSIS